MRKHIYWFLGGVLLTCVLGAAKGQFDAVFCETLSVVDMIGVGKPGEDARALIRCDPKGTLLTLKSPNQKVMYSILVDDDGVFMTCVTPKGTNFTKLSK